MTLSASVYASCFQPMLSAVYNSVTQSAETAYQINVRSYIHGAIYDPVSDPVQGYVYWSIIFTVNGIIKSYDT
jgi:hypothetical protein